MRRAHGPRRLRGFLSAARRRAESVSGTLTTRIAKAFGYDFFEVEQWSLGRKLYVAEHLGAVNREDRAQADADDAQEVNVSGDVSTDIQRDARAVQAHARSAASRAGQGTPPTPSAPSAYHVDGEGTPLSGGLSKGDHTPDADDDEDDFRAHRVRRRSQLTDVHPALRGYSNIVHVRGNKDEDE